MADFLAAYQLKLFDTLTYPLYVGLVLNIPRVRMLGVYSVMQGMRAAQAKKLPVQLFDAVAASDEQAEDMAFDANSQASMADALARARSMI